MKDWIGESILVAAIVALSVVVFMATANLPVPRWEPIGPAALPKAIMSLLLLLCCILIAQRVYGRGTVTNKPEARPDYPIRYGRTVGVIAIVVMAVSSIQMGWLTYRPVAFLTTVFTGFVLSGFDTRRLLPLAALGLVLSFGVHFMFTRILVTDLP